MKRVQDECMCLCEHVPVCMFVGTCLGVQMCLGRYALEGHDGEGPDPSMRGVRLETGLSSEAPWPWALGDFPAANRLSKVSNFPG